MFPSFFKATVRQRLTLWALMLGGLAAAGALQRRRRPAR